MKDNQYSWQTHTDTTLDRLLHKLEERREQLLENLPSEDDIVVDDAFIEEWLSLLHDRDRLTRLKVSQSNEETLDNYMKELQALLEKIALFQGKYVKPNFRQALSSLYKETKKYLDMRDRKWNMTKSQHVKVPDVLIVAAPEYDLVVVHLFDEHLPEPPNIPPAESTVPSLQSPGTFLADSEVSNKVVTSADSELPDITRLSMNHTLQSFNFKDTKDSSTPFHFVAMPAKPEACCDEDDIWRKVDQSNANESCMVIPNGKASIDSADEEYLSAQSSVNISDNDIPEKSLPWFTPKSIDLPSSKEDAAQKQSSTKPESLPPTKDTSQKTNADFTSEKQTTFKLKKSAEQEPLTKVCQYDTPEQKGVDVKNPQKQDTIH